jgi:hypothetical protein
MLLELNEISEQMTEQKDVFSAILKAPEFTFELTIKYIFIFKDLTEIRRTFPDLAKRIDQSNRTRKEALIGVLQFLQAQFKMYLRKQQKNRTSYCLSLMI